MTTPKSCTTVGEFAEIVVRLSFSLLVGSTRDELMDFTVRAEDFGRMGAQRRQNIFWSFVS
jgi:hypothetical protein